MATLHGKDWVRLMGRNRVLVSQQAITVAAAKFVFSVRRWSGIGSMARILTRVW